MLCPGSSVAARRILAENAWTKTFFAQGCPNGPPFSACVAERGLIPTEPPTLIEWAAVGFFLATVRHLNRVA